MENFSGGKGQIPPTNRLKPTLRVCTIEKAAMVVNSLLDEPELVRKLGLCIIDEIHMLGTDRGIWLEDIITKVLAIKKKKRTFILCFVFFLFRALPLIQLFVNLHHHHLLLFLLNLLSLCI